MVCGLAGHIHCIVSNGIYTFHLRELTFLYLNLFITFCLDLKKKLNLLQII